MTQLNQAPEGAGPIPQAPPPPAPPRAITSSVRRRSWGEPIVRFWWLCTIAIVAIGIWLLVQQYLAVRGEGRLIDKGVTVEATVTTCNGESRIGAKYPPGTECTMKFDLNGQTTSVDGTLAYSSDSDYITTGQKVILHVDPNDPTNWTNRDRPAPFGPRLIAGATLVPVGIATALAAIAYRRRVLRIWREGQAIACPVVYTRIGALAPLSFAVRCAVGADPQPELATVYVSTRHPRPRKGDFIWILNRAQNPTAALAASAYGG